MNTVIQEGFYQIRFLLHGNPDRYNSSDVLYRASQNLSVWSRVASKVLEAWRIIPPVLADRIPPNLWGTLKIQEISPQHLITELRPESLTEQDLTTKEDREEVLGEIAKNPKYKDLWKGLFLHEAIDGRLVSITENTYLKDSRFPLPSELQPIVTLISQTSRSEWIPLWTPQAAVAVILSQPHPHKFCNLLLNLLKNQENKFTEEVLSLLKSTAWLPLRTGGEIAPESVIFLLSPVQQAIGHDLEQVFQLENSIYTSPSTLGIEDSHNIPNAIRNTWRENRILTFLLSEIRQSERSSLILKLLRVMEQQQQAVSNENLEKLKTTPWLIDQKGNRRSPQQIIHSPELEPEATDILKQVNNWNYITYSMLQGNLDIRFCLEHLQWRALFLFGEDAIERLGEAIAQLPQYYLGDLPISSSLLRNLIQVFHGCDQMPLLGLSQKMRVEEFECFVLPRAQQPINDIERLREVLNWLTEQYPHPQPEVIEAYNYYLQVACQSVDNFSSEFMPHIQFLNQRKQWCSPQTLCDGERYTGIDSTSILNSRQREIIRIHLENQTIRESSQSTFSIPVSQHQPVEADAEQLEQYFRPWLPYLPSEAIGGFLCLFAGTNPVIRELAQKYLQSRSFDGLRERLLWSEKLRQRNFTITVKAVDSTLQKVDNLLGETINVSLQQNQVPEHVFVGQLDHSIQEITLLKFQLPDNSQVLPDVLTNSAEILIRRIHKTETESIKDIWNDLLNSQQVYVRSTRNYILKYLPPILRMLNVKSQQVKFYLNHLERLDTELEELKIRIDARVRGREEKINEKLKQVKKSLIQLIEEDRNVSLDVLKAVREKIRQGQYGYSSNSIPFELFQNADDALVEFETMLDRKLPERAHFVLTWAEDQLTAMHWGRPINLVTHPDMPERGTEDNGFNRDLIKMLCFNDSSKGENETGKFGLGFKTVHLISQEPRVISGDLKFTIGAGLLPSTLPRPGFESEDANRIDSLKEQLRQAVLSPGITDGTITNLPLDLEATDNIDTVVNDFKHSVGLLIVFAKRIKNCRLINRGSSIATLTWNPSRILGIVGIEFGQIQLPTTDVDLEQWRSYKLLNFCLPSGNVALVIPPNLQNKSPLANLPTFWVTNPTKESLEVRFVVNSSFDITTGRTSLDRNSTRNQDLIRQIGENLGEKLCELFRLSHSNWQVLRQAFDLSEEADAYQFWEFLWNIFVTDWLRLSGDDTTLNLLKIGFCSEYRAYGYLISCHTALPNGLFNQARQLVRVDRIRYKVTGLLAEQEIFSTVLNWHSFTEYYPASSLVHQNIWQHVKKLLNSEQYEPDTLKISDVLTHELGNCHVSPDVARSIGQVINPEKMGIWRTSQSSEYGSICENILETTIFFMNQAGGFLAAALLLSDQTDNQEEQRLVAFAMPNRILHSDYTDTALQFFLACRSRRDTVSIEDLVAWARAANTDAQRQAILEYLSHGDRNIEFASQLRNATSGSWMEDDPRIKSLLQTKARQEQEERAIRGEIEWDDLPSFGDESDGASLNSPDGSVQTPQEDPGQLLRDIYHWWQVHYQAEIRRYNQRVYPIPIEELQQGLRDGDRNAWLILFFMGATHTMGRTKHEQHRDFVRFCIDHSWWATFSTPDPQGDSEQWMSVLNEYIDSLRDDTTWYYWMEKYPSIYQVAMYLDGYRESFLRADRIQRLFDLSALTNPRLSTDLSGGGVDAPPLRLGIGANFVIRELVRLGIVEPTQHVLPHCFVPRANVRRVMMRLGCPNLQASDYRYSRQIYQFLEEEFTRLKISGNPTFQSCCDIPFELYAESKQLNLHRFQVRDDVAWYEDVSDEEHTQYESSGNSSDFVTLSDGRVIPRSYMD